jgi:hypothetical protein
MPEVVTCYLGGADRKRNTRQATSMEQRPDDNHWQNYIRLALG